MGVNANALKDLACPDCGSRGPFCIDMGSGITVHDAGATVSAEDLYWDFNSYCRCEECDSDGEVKHFTFDGLDDLLAEKASKAS